MQTWRRPLLPCHASQVLKNFSRQSCNAASDPRFRGILLTTPLSAARDRRIVLNDRRGPLLRPPEQAGNAALAPEMASFLTASHKRSAPSRICRSADRGSLPSACSGDIYSMVPTSAPVWVMPSLSRVRARPKSIDQRAPLFSRITFCGFRSRWMMPTLWAGLQRKADLLHDLDRLMRTTACFSAA